MDAFEDYVLILSTNMQIIKSDFFLMLKPEAGVK